MKILISDTSCLIDLRKVSLLEAFVKLPYNLAIPDVLFHQEVLKFSGAEKELVRREVKVVSLPGEKIQRAREVSRNNSALTLNDCFAFVLAENTPNCILMTGDRSLRGLASRSGIDVHGILWGVDEMHATGVATVKELHSALLLFKQDGTVRLPAKELEQWIIRYQTLL
jgi:predicted nucleic acid-binding protein